MNEDSTSLLKQELKELESKIEELQQERNRIRKEVRTAKILERRRKQMQFIRGKATLNNLKYCLLIVVIITTLALSIGYLTTIIPFSEFELLLEIYPWLLAFVVVFPCFFTLLALVVYLMIFKLCVRRRA